jgi:dihydrofolate reductase
MIHLIVAMTNCNIIGNDGKLIWQIKEDMKLFKENTIEQTVIMGKNTWESIPTKFRPLPKRNNIVISRSLNELASAEVANSIEESLKIAKKYNKEIFCIGGAQIYKEFLEKNLVEVLHISWVQKNYDGNIYFPKIDFNNWKEIEKKEFEEFTYKKYIKK